MDEARRENTHRDFIQSGPTAAEVRVYLVEAPHALFGEWREDETSDGAALPGHWAHRAVARPDGQDPKCVFIDSERAAIQKLFGALLGDDEPFCEHGMTWLEECPQCEAIEKLIAKGLDPILLNKLEVGAEPRKGSHNANKVLSVLGLGMSQGKIYAAAGGNGAQMEKIAAAKQLEEKIGGRRVKPKGIGRDSDAPVGDDDRAAGIGHTNKEKNFAYGVDPTLIDSTSVKEARDTRILPTLPFSKAAPMPSDIADVPETESLQEIQLDDEEKKNDF